MVSFVRPAVVNKSSKLYAETPAIPNSAFRFRPHSRIGARIIVANACFKRKIGKALSRKASSVNIIERFLRRPSRGNFGYSFGRRPFRRSAVVIRRFRTGCTPKRTTPTDGQTLVKNRTLVNVQLGEMARRRVYLRFFVISVDVSRVEPS